MNNMLALSTLIIASLGLIFYLTASYKKRKELNFKINQPFPEIWLKVLDENVLFYKNLPDSDKQLFEKRVQIFLASKSITGIDTDIDDTIRLMVASGAIIPTFAFPNYNYPHVHTILIYPNSFDERFQTNRFEGHQEFITGIVGNRALNGCVILSKPDLIKGFNGLPNQSNVGIHEFVHLLDKEDGEIDGIPEVLIQQPFVAPWLNEIKKEAGLIETGKSDINPYALTNNAEFLAVVSEYFFDNPDKFQKRHPELYHSLNTIFSRNQIEAGEKPQ